MVGVYKDPEGNSKSIFPKAAMSPTDNLGISSKEASETSTMRKRIRDLEKELKEMVWIVFECVLCTQMTHDYNQGRSR